MEYIAILKKYLFSSISNETCYSISLLCIESVYGYLLGDGLVTLLRFPPGEGALLGVKRLKVGVGYDKLLHDFLTLSLSFLSTCIKTQN